MNDFFRGIKNAIPIAIGYVAVSFAFGVMCVNDGVSPLVAIIMSLTNLTSAGQFAGEKLMIELAPLLEIGITVLLINLRYLLMSISLSQRIDIKMPLWKRFIMSFGITDEIYATAISEKDDIKASYMIGLTTIALFGWILGTTLGCFFGSLFPSNLLEVMNISLYSMFLSAIIPNAKKSKSIIYVIGLAIFISCILYYVPIFSTIGTGFKTIISTIIACIFGSILFPRTEEESL